MKQRIRSALRKGRRAFISVLHRCRRGASLARAKLIACLPERRTLTFEMHSWRGWDRVAPRYRALDFEFWTLGFVTIGSSRVLLTDQLRLLAKAGRALVSETTTDGETP